MSGFALRRWVCHAQRWCHEAHWPGQTTHRDACDGQREWRPSDALTFYRSRAPICPRDARHGPMALMSQEDWVAGRIP